MPDQPDIRTLSGFKSTVLQHLRRQPSKDTAGAAARARVLLDDAAMQELADDMSTTSRHAPARGKDER